MEIRAFAERVLRSTTLQDKLWFPAEPFTDQDPGEPFRPDFPGRPPELVFDLRRRGAKMPHRDALREPRLRATAHHIMANHELQALEVMAFTLCAFPDAPADFRLGLLNVLRDEQRHTRMHLARLRAHGVSFGQLPVNGYVWIKAQEFESPLDYCAGLALLFEGGNLDHSLEFAEIFLRFGDHAGAEVMRRIHHDEIEHVAFGLEWLRKMKDPGQSDWDAFVSHLHEPLKPEHAVGKVFQKQARFQTGMAPDFVDRLEQLHGAAARPSTDRSRNS